MQPPTSAVTRRAFLARGAAGAAVAAAGTVSFGSRVEAEVLGMAPAALQGGGTAGPGRICVVFLRGGMDGMSAVVPHAEAAYHDARPGIRVPQSQVIDLDGFFGLHPALAPLHPLFVSGRLGIVHACGNPAGSRSHFEAQRFVEQGDVSNSADGLGWLARHLLDTARPDDAVLRAVALGATLPVSLRGSSAVAMTGVDSFALQNAATLLRHEIETWHAGGGGIDIEGTRSLDAIDAIGSMASVALPGGNGGFGSALGDALTLFDSGLGTEIVTIDFVDEGGWDTHEAMGTPAGGRVAVLLGDLGSNLAAFSAALSARGHGDVVTLVMTEFGRRLAENGSGGADHGFGSVMLAMGERVTGGNVLGTWPGLSAGNLVQGDLAVSTDFRDVMWEAVVSTLGSSHPERVFPGHAHTPVGLL